MENYNGGLNLVGIWMGRLHEYNNK